MTERIRVEYEDQWADVLDPKELNFGDVRKLRVRAMEGDEGAIKVSADLIAEWNAKDHKTGETLGAPSLEALDRCAPAFALEIIRVVGERLSSSLPLASTKESPTT